MTQEAIEISTTPPLPGLKLVQDVNKALQTIATDFAGPTDPAGLTGCGPYCTWADTANGLRKRRNGANTDWVVIGSLFLNAGTDHAGSEPANPIPFMTWADTANGLVKRRSADNAAWVVEGKLFDYHYSRSSVVGPVGQTGGVPTGAVIQSGGDSVNSYVRLADGTQICRRRFTITSEIQIPWGNIFESVEFGLGNYAIPFIAPPAVGVSCEGTPSWSGVATPGTASIWPTMKLFRATASGSGLSLTLCGLAVGRWF